MGAVLSIVRYTFLQQFRNRLYLLVFLFAGVMAAAALVLGALSADAELAVILDLGLAAAELMGLFMAVLGAVTLVLEEVESRTVYLILTRPVPRWVYVVGRFAGLLLAVWAAMGVMGAVHLGVLLLKGWSPDAAFFAAFPFMALRTAVLTSVALFFSLFSSSPASSVVFSAFFWLLGHFGRELEFLASKTVDAVSAAALKAVLVVLPRLDLLDFRDVIDMPGVPVGALFLRAAVYGGLYTGACLALSLTLFSRKEF